MHLFGKGLNPRPSIGTPVGYFIYNYRPTIIHVGLPVVKIFGQSNIVTLFVDNGTRLSTFRSRHTDPNGSEKIRMDPNRSEQIRTDSNGFEPGSEWLEKLAREILFHKLFLNISNVIVINSYK